MAVLFACGCASDPFPALHPLTGTVRRDGKPVAGGGLIFLPESGSQSGLVVNASIRADGTFEARSEWTGSRETLFRPGAPAATYRVIYHPPGDGSKTDQAVPLDESLAVEAKENVVSIAVPLAKPKEPSPRE